MPYAIPISSKGISADSPHEVPMAGKIPYEIASPASSRPPAIANIASDGYINTKPHTKYITHAIENNPRFLVTISDTSFFWTRPASNIVKPAAIHITRAPDMIA